MLLRYKHLASRNISPSWLSDIFFREVLFDKNLVSTPVRDDVSARQCVTSFLDLRSEMLLAETMTVPKVWHCFDHTTAVLLKSHDVDPMAIWNLYEAFE